MRVIPPTRSANFHATQSESSFYFLRHENLFKRLECNTHSERHLNLQRKLVRDNLQEMLLIYLWSQKLTTPT